MLTTTVALASATAIARAEMRGNKWLFHDVLSHIGHDGQRDRRSSVASSITSSRHTRKTHTSTRTNRPSVCAVPARFNGPCRWLGVFSRCVTNMVQLILTYRNWDTIKRCPRHAVKWLHYQTWTVTETHEPNTIEQTHETLGHAAIEFVERQRLASPDMLTSQKCTQHVLHGCHATVSKNLHRPVNVPHVTSVTCIATSLCWELPSHKSICHCPCVCGTCLSTTAITRSAWAQQCKAHVKQCKYGRYDIYTRMTTVSCSVSSSCRNLYSSTIIRVTTPLCCIRE